jgi:hypothetical protein
MNASADAFAAAMDPFAFNKDASLRGMRRVLIGSAALVCALLPGAGTWLVVTTAYPETPRTSELPGESPQAQWSVVPTSVARHQSAACFVHPYYE